MNDDGKQQQQDHAVSHHYLLYNECQLISESFSLAFIDQCNWQFQSQGNEWKDRC